MRHDRSVTSALVWLSPQQVIDHVPGLTLDRLRSMRTRGVGPRFYKPTHKTVIYSAADIDAWVLGSVVETRDPSRPPGSTRALARGVGGRG